MEHFPTLTQNQLFRNGRTWDMDFVHCVCDAMGNPSSVTESEIHPNRVFIELYKYKCRATYVNLKLFKDFNDVSLR